MTLVEEIMVRDVVTFKPSDPVHFVAWSLREKKISGAPVVAGGKVTGIVSERDIMKLLEEKQIKINLLLPSPFDVIELPLKMRKELQEIYEIAQRTAKMPVEKIMVKKVITISKDASVAEAAKIMGDRKINRLPVVDRDGNLLGIITRGDIISTLI